MNQLTDLLTESWALVAERQDRVAALFYARLFLSHPSLREKFPVRLDPATSPMWHTIITMVLASGTDNYDSYLAELGRAHRKHLAGPEDYDAVGASLVEALRLSAGDRWRGAYDKAWLEAFAGLARTMLHGADGDDGPATWRAEVVRHERRSRDIACFTCRPETPLPYRAGQYVSIECDHHPSLWRPYSIANAPGGDGLLDFHVRARGAGWVSGALVRRLRPGDVIRLAHPSGTMRIDRLSNRDVVCVAGGTGLAPIKALVQDLAGFNRTRWVHLFVGARDRDDLYDLPDLSAMAERYPWLSVVPACSDDPTYPGERGTVPDIMRGYGPWTHHDVYVAGPPDMVRATLRTLAGMRVPSARVHYDRVLVQPVVEIPGSGEAVPHRGAA